MEEGGGSGGMGGMQGGVSNLLDARAQAFYPAVGAPFPFQPLQNQLYCPPPQPYQVMPLPPPVPLTVPPPPPSMPATMAPPQPGYCVPAAAATVVDGPASRAVVLSLVPPHAPEDEVARAMSPFGAVRAVDASDVASEGVATVYFFDIRAAELAVAGVREQHIRQQCRLGQLYAAAASPPTWPPTPATTGWDWPHDDNRGLVFGQAVWAHFAAASTVPDDGACRGSLVVLNSLPGISVFELREVFQQFGDVKEVRESAQRPSHKFVEFFDTRDAARALAELNGQELFGRRLIIEYTRPSLPGGPRRRGHVSHQPLAPTPPRLQAAWRPAAPSPSPAAQAAQPSSSSSRKSREGVVILRRSSGKGCSGSQSKGGGNAGHERKGKGGKNAAATACSSTASASSSTATATTKQGQKGGGGGGRGGSWRGQKSGWEARFLFKEQPDAAAGAASAGAGDAAASSETQETATCKDTRTTVMIRNIPNKYSQKLLLNMLDNHCILSNQQIEASCEDEGGDGGQPLSSYDFLYLPIDFNNKCNVGYGFVNLTSPEAAVRLYKAFHKQPWEVFNSRKICQGLDALKEHFKNSKFPCDSDEYLPVVFSPPRDGKLLTEPVPLVGRSPAPSSASGASSPSKSRATSVDPLAQELMTAPSSSGDGASSTAEEEDDVNGATGSGDVGDDEDDAGLDLELQRLGYTD